MNQSQNAPSNEGQGGRSNQLFNDDDYKHMVEGSSVKSDMSGPLRPQSPYIIPQQTQLDQRHRTSETPDQCADTQQTSRGFDTPAFQSDFRD